MHCRGDVNEIDRPNTHRNGRGRRESFRTCVYRRPIQSAANQPSSCQIAFHHGKRLCQLGVDNFLSKPLETQRISNLDLVQAVHQDSLSPLRNELSDHVAHFFAYVKLDQYARVVVEAHRSPRPSETIRAALSPLTGSG